MRRRTIPLSMITILILTVSGTIVKPAEFTQPPQSKIKICWKTVEVGDGNYEVTSLVLLEPEASAHVKNTSVEVWAGERVKILARFVVGDFRVIRPFPYKVTFHFKVGDMEKETKIWMLPKVLFVGFPDLRWKKVKIWFQAPKDEGIYRYNVLISVDGPKASAEDRGILTLEVKNSRWHPSSCDKLRVIYFQKI